MSEKGETKTSIFEDGQVVVAFLFGLVLFFVGIIGPILGGGAEGKILGIFGRNYLHDIIHVLTGLGGLIAGYAVGGRYADEYNKYLGIVYLVVTALGFIMFGVFAELINLNMADNILHLILGIILAGVGFGLAKK